MLQVDLSLDAEVQVQLEDVLGRGDQVSSCMKQQQRACLEGSFPSTIASRFLRHHLLQGKGAAKLPEIAGTQAHHG